MLSDCLSSCPFAWLLSLAAVLRIASAVGFIGGKSTNNMTNLQLFAPF